MNSHTTGGAGAQPLDAPETALHSSYHRFIFQLIAGIRKEKT